ncbi:YbaB/EbfC family nucleoid-associated protein [Micromonospora coxensis]|uniref:YbaB/EbfC DNA-binding family protein n=1 Tax=Micromonospora coxensis TaxID=356852 RepID=A0A1C5IDE5_9ACTN|nr:YbaB/EbfC family nucleoid-associated protein [Micromonospora coxensis]SCG56049.1 YbaB/EbfC DNA-binding family protein [Micromonospora coxensis]
MLGESALEQQLAEARAALREVSRTVVPPERVESVAEAADGRIRVTVGVDGRLSAVDLDPRVLREGSEYLADELRRAVNAALDGQADAVTGTEPMPDLAAMAATVERLQDQGLRQMREISTAISETMRKLQQRS